MREACFPSAPGAAGDLELRGAVESRVNHSLQGLGVSYAEEAGQGCGLAGAAHSGGEGGVESRGEAGRALGTAEARVSDPPFIERPETLGSPRRELPAPPPASSSRPGATSA